MRGVVLLNWLEYRPSPDGTIAQDLKAEVFVVRERDLRIDAMKGVAICLVVLGHVIAGACSNWEKSAVLNVIYSFHMPLFMFLSGLLLREDSLRSDFLMKRFNALVIPFLAWLPVSAYFCAALAGQPKNLGLMKAYILGALKHPDHGGLWFLWVLFLINAIYYTAARSGKRVLFLAAFMVALVGSQWFFEEATCFGLDLVKWHLPFFLFGVMSNRFPGRFGLSTRWVLLLLPLFVLLEHAWWMSGVDSFGFRLTADQQRVYNALSGYAVAFLAIGYSVWLAGFVKKLSPIVSWLSENSLPVYSLHVYPLLWIADLLKPQSLGFTGFFAVLSGTWILSVLAIMGIKRSEFLQRLLFGQKGGLLGGMVLNRSKSPA